MGQTLTGTFMYADADDDAQGVSTFRWLRNGTAITGAGTATYTLTVADEGTRITFEVTPVAQTGSPTVGSATQSAATGAVAAAVGSAPTASSVTISGTATVGQTLTASYVYADADGDAEGATTYQWLRDGAPIGGATASTYALAVADEGALVSVQVTAVAATGSPNVGGATASAPTAAVAPAAGAAPTAGTVAIGGTPTVGQVLTGTYVFADDDADLEGASAFRWLRGGVAIPGATSVTYTLTVAEEGAQIVFEVTPVSITGSPKVGVAAQSTATAGIGPADGVGPVASDLVVSGTTDVGDTLRGTYSYSDADGDAEGVSTYRWLRDGVEIVGAADSFYVLSILDVDAMITLEVTPVALTGSPKVGGASVSTAVGPVLQPVDVVPLRASYRAPEMVTLRVFDLRGASVLVTQALASHRVAASESLRQLAVGTYLVRVYSARGTFVRNERVSVRR